MLRACEAGAGVHYVLADDAQLLRIEPSGPTEGRRVYACHEHIRAGGLLPIAAAALGHRDVAPVSVVRRPS